MNTAVEFEIKLLTTITTKTEAARKTIGCTSGPKTEVKPLAIRSPQPLSLMPEAIPRQPARRMSVA